MNSNELGSNEHKCDQMTLNKPKWAQLSLNEHKSGQMNLPEPTGA